MESVLCRFQFRLLFLRSVLHHQYCQDEVFVVMIVFYRISDIHILSETLGIGDFSCSTCTKEMGIRNVLGTSRWNLFYQLVKEFFLLILIAVVIQTMKTIMSKPARSLRYE